MAGVHKDDRFSRLHLAETFVRLATLAERLESGDLDASSFPEEVVRSVSLGMS
jgi:hypothetical protein